MIKKIYIFNEKFETILRRIYSETLPDEEIRQLVLSSPDCNFIQTTDSIVYKKFNSVYVCFVTENENEMYILNLINHFINIIDKILGSITCSSLICNFKDFHVILDNFIMNGKVICFDPSEISTFCLVQEENK